MAQQRREAVLEKQRLSKGYMESLELKMYYRDSVAELTCQEKASKKLVN